VGETAFMIATDILTSTTIPPDCLNIKLKGGNKMADFSTTNTHQVTDGVTGNTVATHAVKTGGYLDANDPVMTQPSTIVDSHGVPLGTDTNKFEVKVSELESRIGEVSATPTANTLLSRIKSLEDKLDNVINATDGVLKVSQYGHNVPVEENVIANAIAVVDSDFHTIEVDFSKYKRIFCVVKNTHDQDCELKLDVKPAYRPRIWDGTNWNQDRTVIIPSDQGGIYGNLLNSRYEWLEKATTTTFRFGYQFSPAAPTSGSLTIIVWGVPNN